MRYFNFSAPLLFVLVLQFTQSSLCQSSSTSAERDKTPSSAIKMTATSTVSSCVKVEAVLLPREPASKLFSGYVARNYAVVKTTISNHCDKQQFILHDLYFDYSNWALSGVYAEPGSEKSCGASQAVAPRKCDGESCMAVTLDSSDCCDKSGKCSTDTWTQGTKPGQVATVGAMDIQDQVAEDSVFSKRNLVVNGLTLVGQIAGGYAFAGGTAAAQGIGAYNSAFVPNLSKFWPDRRLDQEKFLLSLGYRTDQSTAIAKDDHGSYYAFFPLATFLTPDLEKLFLDDPAVFLNPAEAWLEPHSLDGHEVLKGKIHRGKEDEDELRQFIWRLALAIPGNASPNPLTRERLLLELSSECNGEGDCKICLDDQKLCPSRVLAEKTLFRKASLNSGKIVARGVMTVDLDAVNPSIASVVFDGEKSGSSLWTVSTTVVAGAKTVGVAKPVNATSLSAGEADRSTVSNRDTSGTSDKTLTGIAKGTFLEGATMTVVGIDVPNEFSAKVGDYVDTASIKTDSARSSDLSLVFSMSLRSPLPTGAMLPSGTRLTFQALRAPINNLGGGSSNGSDSSSLAKLPSNEYVYKVSYDPPPAEPTISKIAIDNNSKSNVWQTIGRLPGTVTGSNLKGGTVEVSSLVIGGKAAKTAEFIGTISGVRDTSDAGNLDFELILLKAIPDGSEVTFDVKNKIGDNEVRSNAIGYKVAKASITAEKQKPAKPASKEKKTVH